MLSTGGARKTAITTVPVSEKLITLTPVNATRNGEGLCATRSVAIPNAATAAFAETRRACARKDLLDEPVLCECARKTVWGMVAAYRQASVNVILALKALGARSDMLFMESARWQPENAHATKCV